MRIGEVIGTVTLCRVHPLLAGATFKLVTPFDWRGLTGDEAGRGEALVVYDDLGSGIGSTIAICEGTEAAAPFTPDLKPVDAYCAALLDSVDVQPFPKS